MHVVKWAMPPSDREGRLDPDVGIDGSLARRLDNYQKASAYVFTQIGRTNQILPLPARTRSQPKACSPCRECYSNLSEG